MIPYGHQCIEEEDIEAVIQVLKGDWLTTGPYVDEFEKALCSYTGASHGIAVNSATSALDIAVQALCLPPGSEVISTPFTFAASNNALLYHSMHPVFADIQHATRNIDPEDIRKRITKKTKAIIYVDYAGQPCDIDEIREIADEHDLLLIEDAAHALGASYKGKKIGTFADITIFSFHPVKPITTGEGGVAMTNDPVIAKRLALLRSHGIEKGNVASQNPETAWQYDMNMLGRNYRLTDIQAALGLSQIKKLDPFIQKRNSLAERYKKELADVPFLELPQTLNPAVHGWHLFTVLVKGINRNHFFGYLRNHGIGVNVHYIPTYRLSYYREHVPTDFSHYPVTEDIFNRIVSLPIYPAMTEKNLEYVIDTIRKYPKTVQQK
jgi:UDP-4-amino-4,6-dideoxy-N-acetyl-beta-L-altrosamine transaminase